MENIEYFLNIYFSISTFIFMLFISHDIGLTGISFYDKETGEEIKAYTKNEIMYINFLKIIYSIFWLIIVIIQVINLINRRKQNARN